jgi:hypothetical protein
MCDGSTVVMTELEKDETGINSGRERIRTFDSSQMVAGLISDSTLHFFPALIVWSYCRTQVPPCQVCGVPLIRESSDRVLYFLPYPPCQTTHFRDRRSDMNVLHVMVTFLHYICICFRSRMPERHLKAVVSEEDPWSDSRFGLR